MITHYEQKIEDINKENDIETVSSKLAACSSVSEAEKALQGIIKARKEMNINALKLEKLKEMRQQKWIELV